ncbi:hypothetical protein AA103196_1572 [Ameyamaea chiangmaiensis NBRC 103196]|uniref:Endonuclease/exonuclease/phosphatase domain-containing protein n=1 Tax=Ameyamaea chiangmaiensis TaxID=442969 RepID=A0A850P7N1_9PROT|nr:hypothetical protein [Ameyamaea chiangmaiensis]MBS4076097.1 hypothetical protein [Ameyamaea chiangmaiensis]NVN40607.1 hypothetical protein [Ameyamaea chiangmaiensis]GBQ67013.1 hypothetical protein AA103196_1572 [Ameyamaea chiangmaiensis NBRC 103196]
MNKSTIIVYHSLEATGAGINPSVRSQNLSPRSHSNTQHTHNDRDYIDMKRDSVRRYGYPDAETFCAPAERARYPQKPQAPLATTQWDEHAGRVVQHLGVLRGTADRSARASDDAELQRRTGMFRSASRQKFGRDADLTVLGEAVLDDPSYTARLNGNRADPAHYEAQSILSPNRKTSNAFSVVDGFDSGSALNFSSRATVVASGQSFVVVGINGLRVAFVHTPNSVANTPGARDFYAGVLATGSVDILLGDTNRNGMIAQLLGPDYRNILPSQMTTVARPDGFPGGKTNSTRTKPFDQIVYNPETTEMVSAHFIPSDISGATISDHFGLILCARKKAGGGKKRDAQSMTGGVGTDSGAPHKKQR